MLPWRRVAALALVAWLAMALVVTGAGERKRRRRRKRVNTDASNFFSGVTPSGSTKWKAEGKGVISTTVDTSHLGFDRVPKYFCTVVDGRRPYLAPVNATVMATEALSTLTNVTGKSTPFRPTNAGFKVRLRFKPEANRNLTETDARLGGWRVRWAAVSEPHSLFEEARKYVENDKYDMGIEEKPVGQALAYVTMLDRLAREDTQFVQGVLGADFSKPASQRPKPKKPKAEKPDEEAAKKEAENGDSDEKASTDAAAAAAAGAAADSGDATAEQPEATQAEA